MFPHMAVFGKNEPITASGRFRQDMTLVAINNMDKAHYHMEFVRDNILMLEAKGMNKGFIVLWERHEDGWKTRSTNICVEHYDASGNFRGIELVIQQ